MTNDDRSLERAARSWLEEGPTRAPDRAVEAALSRIHTTRQERDLWIPWRLPKMFTNRVAVAALALVLVIVGGGFALSRMSGPGGVQPTTPPTPSPSPLPTITISSVGTPLASGTYQVDGFAVPFTITLPAGWTANEFTSNSISLADQSNASINVYLVILDKVYPDPCHTSKAPTTFGSAVGDMVTRLTAMPGFTVTALTDVTVGGAVGKTFLFSNAIDVAAAKCSGSMLPFGTRADNGKDIDVAMFGSERDRFWVVNAGGQTVLIAVTDSNVQTIQPLLDSLTFIGARAG